MSLVRYCPSCGRVGPKPEPPFVNCCPEHHHAIEVPQVIAEQAALGFMVRGNAAAWLQFPGRAVRPAPRVEILDRTHPEGPLLLLRTPKAAAPTREQAAALVRLCSTCRHCGLDGHAEPCRSCIPSGTTRSHWESEA